MLADISKAGSAEQSVGDGVEHDVGVAVTGKAAAVRHLDAAEHHRPLAREGVDVEAHAGPRAETTSEPLLGPFEIGGQGQLRERRVALDSRDLHARGTKHGRFIGRGWSSPALVRGPKAVHPKRLGRLNAREAAAVDGVADGLAEASERVSDGQDWSRALVEFEA